jgi:DNA-binding NarL/FixJ family response regulator
MTMRVLIVDDSPDFLANAATMLAEQGLRVVGRASTSDEALRLALIAVPDVALVDFALGAESGLDLIPKLLQVRRDMSVIVVSAYAPVDVEELVAESDADGFLPKERLSAAAIRQLLG